MTNFDPYRLDPAIASKLTHRSLRDIARENRAKPRHMDQIISVLRLNIAHVEQTIIDLQVNRPEWFYRT